MTAPAKHPMLHDDATEFGAKFADMDPIGTPWQVIVGPKGVARAAELESQDRRSR